MLATAGAVDESSSDRMREILSMSNGNSDMFQRSKSRKRCEVEMASYPGIVQENLSKATRGPNVVDIKDVRSVSVNFVLHAVCTFLMIS